jgi:putative intracellular protease/amidase
MMSALGLELAQLRLPSDSALVRAPLGRFSDDIEVALDFCLIVAPAGYDEPETLRHSSC